MEDRGWRIESRGVIPSEVEGPRGMSSDALRGPSTSLGMTTTDPPFSILYSRFTPSGKRDRRGADMKKIVFLFLVCALALSGCGMFQSKKSKDKKSNVDKPADAKLRDENADVDFQAFVGRLKKAVAAHDVNTLASMMTENFGYSLNPEKS